MVTTEQILRDPSFEAQLVVCGEDEAVGGHKQVLHEDESPRRPQPLDPVYPVAHGGSEGDAHEAADQPEGGHQGQVLGVESEDQETETECPESVPPGGQGAGEVELPRCLHHGVTQHTIHYPQLYYVQYILGLLVAASIYLDFHGSCDTE